MKCFFVSLFLCYSLFGNAQATNFKKPETHWDMFKYDVGNMFGGMGFAYSRPLHWKKNDWGNLGIIAAGTGAIYLIEEPASDYARRIRDDIPKSIREYGKEVGSPSNNYLITGTVYVTGLVTKNEKLRRTGVLLISSASAAGVLQQVLKSAVGRARPLSDLSNDTFNPLWSTGNKDFHSFPSGHAILAMTNAHAIAKQFKNGWVKGGVYTLGAIPGISRLWEGKHWVSDIVLGWAISILTVESIDRYLDKKYEEKYNDSNKKLSWNLNFGAGQMGVVVQF